MSDDAAPLRPRPRSGWAWTSELPAMLVAFMAMTTGLAVAAGWLGVPLLQHRAGSIGLLLLALVLTVLMYALSRPGPDAEPSSGSWVLLLPSVGVLATLVTLMAVGGPTQLEWFLNGDHPRHAVYVADTWNQGTLTYAVESYPRGWHALLATVWSVFGAGLDAASVDRLLRVMSTASLLLSAALALALSNLGMSLASRLGLRRPIPVVVGVGVGSASLLNFSFANYQALGYENSLVAAVVLAVCGREVIARAGSLRAVLVCACAAVVSAHAWQLVLPAVGVATAYCCWRFVRSGADRAVHVALATATVSGVLALPGLVSVVRTVGLDHAAEVGPDSPVPVVLLTAGVVASAVLSWRTHDGRTRVLATVTLLPAVTAVLLSGMLGLELTEYYPSKLLWLTAVVGLAWSGVAIALTLRALGTRAPWATPVVRVVGGAAVGLLVLYGLLMPWGAPLGVWSTVDGNRVLAAVTTPGADRAQVVWLQRTLTDDAIARSLLDVYRVGDTRTRSRQARLSLAEECAALERAASPVVLSTADASTVRDRYACVAGVLPMPVTGLDRP